MPIETARRMARRVNQPRFMAWVGILLVVGALWAGRARIERQQRLFERLEQKTDEIRERVMDVQQHMDQLKGAR